jgi:glycine cleavage system aminomethyltransferase T
MYIPRDFGDPEQNFWNLVNDAILCDVAVERQVEITGPDAAKFVQMLTPRDLSKMAVGQCKYILITNADGGILNDPILLRLAENHFWISLADSDILLWAQGVAVHSGMDVSDLRTRCISAAASGTQIRPDHAGALRRRASWI